MIILRIISIIVLLILLVLSYYGLKYLWPLPISGEWISLDDSSESANRDTIKKLTISKNSIKSIVKVGEHDMKTALDYSDKDNEYTGLSFGPDGHLLVVDNKDNTISCYTEKDSSHRTFIGKFKKV